MKILPIVWQRLVDESGQTCERCRITHEEIQKASELLKRGLFPLGMEVTLEEREIDHVAFANDPSRSNQIWISERPLEEWLGAKVGQSPCCDFCGDVECRTIEFDAKVYEYIPADLIIEAGLIAASQLYGDFPSEKYSQKDSVVQPNISSCCNNSISDSCCYHGSMMPLQDEQKIEIKQLWCIGKYYFDLVRKIKNRLPEKVLSNSIKDITNYYFTKLPIADNRRSVTLLTAHIASCAIRLVTIEEILGKQISRQRLQKYDSLLGEKENLTNEKLKGTEKQIIHFLLRHNIAHCEPHGVSNNMAFNLMENFFKSLTIEQIFKSMELVMNEIEKDIKEITIIN